MAPSTSLQSATILKAFRWRHPNMSEVGRAHFQPGLKQGRLHTWNGAFAHVAVLYSTHMKLAPAACA
eukprot:9743491-Lingulodinium_polyedra.AAC.1